MAEFGPNGQVVSNEAGQPPAPVKGGVYKADGKTFQSLSGRYKFVRFFLTVYAVSTLAMILTNGIEIYFIRAQGVDLFEEANTPSELAFVIAALAAVGLMILSYLTCVVAVSMWTHRAMTNLHILRSPVVEMSPGWAVGWYFIPLANLFQPYRGMAQIWEGSLAAAKLPLAKKGRLSWWWGMWIASNIISNASTRFFGLNPEPEAYVTSLCFDITAAILSVFATWFLWQITKQVSQAQDNVQSGVDEVFA